MTWLILTGLATIAAIALHDWRTKGTRAQQAVREDWPGAEDYWAKFDRELADERGREWDA